VAGPIVVVDTMAVGALLHPSGKHPAAPAYRERIDGRPVVVSFVSVTELRYGALKANWGELRRRGLDRDIAKLTVVQPDDALMTRCAELRNRCERAGHALASKIHDADRWIAATALHLDATLISDDGIYRKVAGLTLA
jgi:predicted nucleic acid-binding protein